MLKVGSLWTVWSACLCWSLLIEGKDPHSTHERRLECGWCKGMQGEAESLGQLTKSWGGFSRGCVDIMSEISGRRMAGLWVCFWDGTCLRKRQSKSSTMRFPAFGHCAVHTLHSCMPHFQFGAPYVWEHFGASLSSYCRFVSTQVHEKLKWSSIHTMLFVWICIGCTVWLALCQVKPSLSGHRRIVGSFVLAGRLESQGETMVTWHDTDVICRENATHGSSWLWIPVPTLLGVEGLLCYLLPAGIYWCQAPFLEQPAEELLDLAETLLICCCCYCMSLDHARSIFLDFFNCFFSWAT